MAACHVGTEIGVKNDRTTKEWLRDVPYITVGKHGAKRYRVADIAAKIYSSMVNVSKVD